MSGVSDYVRRLRVGILLYSGRGALLKPQFRQGVASICGWESRKPISTSYEELTCV